MKGSYYWWRKRAKQWRFRLRCSMNCLLSSHRPAPLYILSAPRSGSILFADFCNSLDGVQVHGEILNSTNDEGLPDSVRSERAIIAHIRRSIGSVPAAVGGAKFLLKQFGKRGLEYGVLPRAFPDAKVIVLYRNRICEQFISWKFAKTNGQWFRMDGTSASDSGGETFRVEPAEFEHFSESLRNDYREAFDNAWLRERMLLVEAGEFFSNPDLLFEHRVCPYLGVPFRPVSTQFSKLNKRPLGEVIENYDAVGELLETATLDIERTCLAAPRV